MIMYNLKYPFEVWTKIFSGGTLGRSGHCIRSVNTEIEQRLLGKGESPLPWGRPSISNEISATINTETQCTTREASHGFNNSEIAKHH
jgi:hypothetical protein